MAEQCRGSRKPRFEVRGFLASHRYTRSVGEPTIVEATDQSQQIGVGFIVGVERLASVVLAPLAGNLVELLDERLHNPGDQDELTS